MSAMTTALGDEVTVDVGQQGPYGALLRAGPSGNAAVLVAWERLPSGKFGPIQKSGGVRLGDVLVRLNSVELHQRRFEDVMTMLRNPGILNKRLTFVSKDRYMSFLASQNSHANMMRGGTASGSKSSSPTGGSKSSTLSNAKQSKPFMSVIRRARVNQEGKSPFAEYEVSCSLRVLSRKVETERVVRWSVWKRYSEFESLDKAMRADFGWQIEAKAKNFPSKNSFTFSKLSVDFVEKRRAELDTYWQAMLSVDRIADFSKSHHCSSDLRAFLEVAGHVNSSSEQQSEGGEQPGGRQSGRTAAAANASAARRRKMSARPSSMRKGAPGRRSSAAGSDSRSPPPQRDRGQESLDTSARPQGDQPQQSQQPPAASASVPEEVKPFLKMLKMGIPRPAVEMKMGMAGVDPGLLDQYGDGDGGGG
eukprot:CAMPEP_0182467004 /NCGR_PEP_ID=MMETSP1319-20130603/13072_1 /TAXON_ID=172717 /ORGANISM="Bolidomonas pacifica, Strain RCC208" /LENGTH=419 /DNA_ID=CAMNT_0024667051 /DNA_START=233 /DNA_END=1488 /DNA_ORIENTATION=+